MYCYIKFFIPFCYFFDVCKLCSVEKEMATLSSILAWRIPWTKKPGGLQSMGLQRVRQDWSDLACIPVHRLFSDIPSFNVDVLMCVSLFSLISAGICLFYMFEITNFWFYWILSIIFLFSISLIYSFIFIIFFLSLSWVHSSNFFLKDENSGN